VATQQLITAIFLRKPAAALAPRTTGHDTQPESDRPGSGREMVRELGGGVA